MINKTGWENVSQCGAAETLPLFQVRKNEPLLVLSLEGQRKRAGGHDALFTEIVTAAHIDTQCEDP